MLKEWRKTHSHTQREVAEALKIHTQRVYSYEACEKVPGRRMAVKFYRLADIPIDAWDVEVK